MEEYEKVCEIGRGSFGSVFKIIRKRDGKTLWWKELNYGKMTEKEKQQIVAEVNILRELRHWNIVRYYDRIIDKEKAKIYIVMEYWEGGDMAKIIKNAKKTKDYIPEDLIWKIFSQMVYALNEWHTRKGGKILHRDLKPGNVFFDSLKNVKIGDFGLSRVMGEESVYACTRVGTPYYMSPEQINGDKYDDKSDIWSLGCVIYEIAALRPPFTASNQISLAKKIKDGKLDDLPEKYSSDLQIVLQTMIWVDASKRPSITKLLSLPQISLRLREKKLKDTHAILKKKELEIQKREDEVTKREKEVEAKAKELEELEAKLMKMKNTLRDSESFLTFNNDKYNRYRGTTHYEEENKIAPYDHTKNSLTDNSLELDPNLTGDNRYL